MRKMEETKRKPRTVTVRLKVKPKKGWTFQNFLDMHSTMTTKKVKVIEDGIVEISYTAIGAAKEDVMKAYKVRDKWKHFNVSID